jgi:hypothetical protein
MSNVDDLLDVHSDIEDEQPQEEVKPQKYKNRKGDLKKKASIAKQNLAKGRAKKAENAAKKREQEAKQDTYSVVHESDVEEEEEEQEESEDETPDVLQDYVLSKQAGKGQIKTTKSRPIPIPKMDNARLDKLEQVLMQLIDMEKKKKTTKKKAKKPVSKQTTIVIQQPEKKAEQPYDIFADFKSKFPPR